MPRPARTRSEGDMYHVIARGVNQSLIFEDDSDRKRFLDFLVKSFDENGVTLYCWCLMGNHFHLLVRAAMEKLSPAMGTLLSSYAVYFNTRHGRTGYLFQDRFRSEAINSDEYLMAVVRYIHWNPVKAGLAPTCRYRWSSYDEYLGRAGICDVDWMLGVFGGVDDFVGFHDIEPTEACLDMPVARRRMGDTEAIALVEGEYGAGTLGRIAGMAVDERNSILRWMKEEGVSIRQAQRLTGVGKRIVERA